MTRAAITLPLGLAALGWRSWVDAIHSVGITLAIGFVECSAEPLTQNPSPCGDLGLDLINRYAFTAIQLRHPFFYGQPEFQLVDGLSQGGIGRHFFHDVQ